MTEDPIHDGMNWYGYCAGNPVRFIDPLGLARESVDTTSKANMDWLKEVQKERKTIKDAVHKGTGMRIGDVDADELRRYYKFDAYALEDWIGVAGNCYSYVMGMMVNPNTGKRFIGASVCPGEIAGLGYDGYMFFDTKRGRALIISRIQADAAYLGLEFLEYEESMLGTGGYRVEVYNKSSWDEMHYYRVEDDGTISHQPGETGSMAPVVLTEKEKEDTSNQHKYSMIGVYYLRPRSK